MSLLARKRGTGKNPDCRGCTGWGTLGVHIQPIPRVDPAEILEGGNCMAVDGRNKCGQFDLVFGIWATEA